MRRLARDRWVPPLLLAALAALTWILAPWQPSQQRLTAYFAAVLTLLGTALGAQFFVLAHYLTRASWSVGLRRQAEHIGATVPLFAAFLLPLMTSLPELFSWAAPHTHLFATPGKGAFLSPAAFLLRSAFYLASWSLIGWWFRKRSLAEDEAPSFERMRRTRAAAAPALIWFAFSVTFAAFDWVLSLDPHWYSTLFGVLFFSGSVVATLCVLVLKSVWPASSSKNSASGNQPSAAHRHDLGKLLFAFVVFWAYLAFSQFLLIWYAHLPEETTWYAARFTGGWYWFTIALALGHFVVPFLYLLSRRNKTQERTLRSAAAWLFGFHAIDVYWLVVPTVSPHPTGASAASFAAALLALGVIASVALSRLERNHPEVPINDPRLEESFRASGL